jgi:hypothetical protein
MEDAYNTDLSSSYSTYLSENCHAYDSGDFNLLFL